MDIVISQQNIDDMFFECLPERGADCLIVCNPIIRIHIYNHGHMVDAVYSGFLAGLISGHTYLKRFYTPKGRRLHTEKEMRMSISKMLAELSSRGTDVFYQTE